MRDEFFEVCANATIATGWFVTLMQKTQQYGGPEEGGWWREDYSIVAYQEFPTKEQAEVAFTLVKKLAADKQAAALRTYGNKCLCMLGPDWENTSDSDDGPDEYYVLMTEGLPEEYHSPTRYE